MENSSRSAWNFAPGVGVAVLIASVSLLLAVGHIALDPLVLAILISIIIGNLIGPAPRLAPGVSLSHRILIPAGIILYGTQMDAAPLKALGLSSILYILFLVAAALSVIYFLARRFGIARRICLLLAAGSSVCGASAIMVLSPVIKAEKEETSISLLAITIVGLTGVIIYPLLQESFGMPEDLYAMLCGSTLYQMGQVKAAAALVSSAALETAVPVKLIRIGTLLPIAIVYSLITGSSERRIYIPWFIVASIVVATLVNLLPAAESIRSLAGPAVTFLFTTAIAGIGLTVDLESIIDSGPKPLAVVYMGWVVLVLLFLAGMFLLR